MDTEKIISVDEKNLFKRNIFDEEERLKYARVCVVGLGGIGSNVAVALARSGVGNIHLIDFDTVEESNLNRQYYNISHIGMKKVDALKKVIIDINPFVNLVCDDIKVDVDNICRLIKGEYKEDSCVFESDIICEALDDAQSKAMLITEILGNMTDKIIVSSSGMAGIGDANEIKTERKMKNLYVCGDGYSDFQSVEGMMSPRVNICAGHQANIILRLILGLE